MHSALLEIARRFGAVIQLLLIERRGLLEHEVGTSFWSDLAIEASQAVLEG